MKSKQIKNLEYVKLTFSIDGKEKEAEIIVDDPHKSVSIELLLEAIKKAMEEPEK